MAVMRMMGPLLGASRTIGGRTIGKRARDHNALRTGLKGAPNRRRQGARITSEPVLPVDDLAFPALGAATLFIAVTNPLLW
jgi:hypothetical protein